MTHEHTLLDISKIYIDSKSKNSPVANQVISKFPQAEIVTVKNHWKIPDLNENESILKTGENNVKKSCGNRRWGHIT